MSAGAAFAGADAAATFMGGLLDRSRLRAEARVHTENARLDLLQGEEVIARTMREERQVSGAALAAMAGTGVRVGTGTSADIIRQNALEREIEVGNLRAQAQGASRNNLQAAADARAAGNDALIGATIGAASRIASYASQRDSQAKVDAAVDAERAARLAEIKVGRGGVGLVADTRPPAARGAGFGVHGHDPFQLRPSTRRFGVLSLPGA